ncbi:hypothetical protein Q9Q94_06255 [Uliginosibacterium sp. 31-16]|uniref:hypothetical protein n=1 Tax=Uliginosibacterium sp. 31-16 TaxID=3068315 RepID=UPI00273F20CF|nr:hypothetical protein [Uliginosibacterium sp. 31-16]MDP5239125.1 hypothetical protein [Uliginosibacterium sp. 31-16]
MRFIPASDIFVEKLRQAAKKATRLKKIKLAEAQDRVARAYGFNHWGHVIWCQKATAQRVAAGEVLRADLIKQSDVSFLKEVEYILGLAAAGKSHVVALEHCVLFSTEDGDAWVLDANDGLALCLSWHGRRQDFVIEESAERFFVGYDADFMLREGAFVVRSDNPRIGSRTILGYPAQGLADLFENIRRRRTT